MTSSKQDIISTEQAIRSDVLQSAVHKARSYDWTWLYNGFRRSIAIILFFILWELLPRLGVVDEAFLPPFSKVLAAGYHLIVNGQFFVHLQASLLRSLSGFIIALATAIPLGFAIGWYRGFSDYLNPLLELLRNTSALAVLPVFMLFLGIGESSKIALIIFACVWPILLNTISAVRNVDPLLIKSARTLGLSDAKLFRKVILPAAVPTIFVGIRLAGTSCILVLVAAEMIGAKAGLGYLIIYSQYNFQIPEMFVGIISITAFGFAFNYLLLAVEKHFTAWNRTAG
ncbi:ABC transporter permease [Acinetobacter puyangensis]|uniref:NitT/TauT family transport system permease protein n=1 Tax=Acinetobacter puyangensis TaxID=1096779 RepID=A0A240E8C9_9GAMM|nr:ABC transporter permease [Acinetobacter puyangensis]SNX44469.1 NitT/TauT family transport system permease protein [Acinetobacter puyangensis]